MSDVFASEWYCSARFILDIFESPSDVFASEWYCSARVLTNNPGLGYTLTSSSEGGNDQSFAPAGDFTNTCKVMEEESDEHAFYMSMPNPEVSLAPQNRWVLYSIKAGYRFSFMKRLRY